MPKITSETEALTVLNAVNAFTFFLRVQRGGPSGSSSSSPKTLQIIQEQKFAQDEYYAWFYDGSQWTTYAGGILMVAIMLGGVMFPLWPPTMRLGVWYLSMGMLGLIGLFFAIAVVRLIFYVITVLVVSPGIWIFPQLFADVGFVSARFWLVNETYGFVSVGGLVYTAMGMGSPEEKIQEEEGRQGQGEGEIGCRGRREAQE